MSFCDQGNPPLLPVSPGKREELHKTHGEDTRTRLEPGCGQLAGGASKHQMLLNPILMSTDWPLRPWNLTILSSGSAKTKRFCCSASAPTLQMEHSPAIGPGVGVGGGAGEEE